MRQCVLLANLSGRLRIRPVCVLCPAVNAQVVKDRILKSVDNGNERSVQQRNGRQDNPVIDLSRNEYFPDNDDAEDTDYQDSEANEKDSLMGSDDEEDIVQEAVADTLDNGDHEVLATKSQDQKQATSRASGPQAHVKYHVASFLKTHYANVCLEGYTTWRSKTWTTVKSERYPSRQLSKWCKFWCY